jgi:hypothetical protein
VTSLNIGDYIFGALVMGFLFTVNAASSLDKLALISFNGKGLSKRNGTLHVESKVTDEVQFDDRN